MVTEIREGTAVAEYKRILARVLDNRPSGTRQRIESVFWTLKDRLGLERHRARTLIGIRARVASKLLALAAGVWLNHLLGRPTRAFAALAV